MINLQIKAYSKIKISIGEKPKTGPAVIIGLVNFFKILTGPFFDRGQKWLRLAQPNRIFPNTNKNDCYAFFVSHSGTFVHLSA